MALIAIYDSGVGGLSIYQNVVNLCPEHDYLFISDNQAFPYGTKPEDALLNRAQALVRRLDECFQVEILIVACNTASTVVLPYLREEFSFPIIGVVPAIKPAAELSVTKSIALLATPATIHRPYTQTLIDEFASNCRFTYIGSSELVHLAEDKLYQREVDESRIGIILEPVISNPDIDVMVLACTHFPLLATEIQSQLKQHERQLSLVDSGNAVANRLLSMIQTHSLPSSKNLSRIAMLTRVNDNTQFTVQLHRLGFDKLQLLTV